MEKISIKSNIIKIEIEKVDGSTYILPVNPSDLIFVNNVYAVYSRIDKKSETFDLKMKALLKDKTKDKHGLPANMDKILNLNLEYAEYVKTEIDTLFGEETYQNIFGKSLDFQSVLEFIENLMPFISSKREKKMNKYIDESGKSEGLLS